MSRLRDLEALRDLLWDSLQAADAEKRGPLASQYRGALAEIAELSQEQSKKAGDPIDEIAARRAARGGATSRLG